MRKANTKTKTRVETTATGEVGTTLTTFSSGATSSKKITRYDLCIMDFFRRVAGVFEYGASKHGDVNYQKCIYFERGIKTLDVQFVRDRFNHGFQHYINIKTGEEPDRDNIGAAGWALAMLTWVESHGFPINRLLNPRYVNEIKHQRFSDGAYLVTTLDGKEYYE